MKATEQTLQQIERAIGKIVAKYPADNETSIMTDIRLRVAQDTGDFLAFDDDDKEINRCVIDQWIECQDENFYNNIATILRNSLIKNKEKIEDMGILRPFSFILENDDCEQIAELYLVDDDLVMIDEKELMEGLSEDLDAFFVKLMSE